MPRRSDMFNIQTKSSDNWSCVPGNFDKLNTNFIFPSDNVYGIPTLLKQDFDMNGLIEYGTGVRMGLKYAEGKAIHFFVDDYYFEPMWNSPYKYLGVFQRHGITLGTDFSIIAENPLVLNVFNVYRNRWLARFWQEFDVKVIPTVSWVDEKTWEYVFLGIEKGSPVAFSTVGIKKDKYMHDCFINGFYELLRRVEPSKLVVYGEYMPLDFSKYVDKVLVFDSYWKAKRRNMKDGESKVE